MDAASKVSPKVSPKQFSESLRHEMESFLESVMESVNEAADGAGSVRFNNLRRLNQVAVTPVNRRDMDVEDARI